jgi:cell division protein FtsB
MDTNLRSEELIARYLLGDLSEEQQIEIEDRAFEDNEYLASITAVENDLIDEYVRQELSEAERRKFESRFLASEARRKRVEFAQALSRVPAKTAVAQTVPARPSWRESVAAFIYGLTPAGKFALAAATLLVLLGGAWLITETLRLRKQLDQLQAQRKDRESLEQQVEKERRRNEELAAQLNQEKQQREQTDESLRQLSESGSQPGETPRPVIASLTLLPGISRGGGGAKPKLVLPVNANLVRLQIGIEPEEEYRSFRVKLSTVGGRRVWNRDNLTVRGARAGRAIRLTLPANALTSGEYELRLIGVTDAGRTEDVGFYYFQVSKK